MKKSLILMLTLVSTANASDLFDRYKYDEAAKEHAAATAIDGTDASVTGSYTMIAACSKSYRGEFEKKDINGLKNPDGSKTEMKVESPAAGSLDVYQYNLGAAGQNQGPSAAVFDTATGAMKFAQYSYRAGQVTDDVYFFSECKRLDERRLLCAKRFIANRPDVLKPEQRALHEKIVGYDLYTK